MTRLQNDIRRAAMGSTPNVQKDPTVCGYSATWPKGMRELAGITLVEGGSKAAHGADHTLSALPNNDLNPDSLVLAGNLVGTEQYSVAAIQSSGGGAYDLFLEADGAYWRTKLAALSGDGLDRVFIVGRFVRLVDQEGRSAFGVISGVDTSGSKPRVTVGGTPSLPKRETQKTCGCTGLCTGSMLNPIQRVRYDLRKVDATKYPRYAGMFPKANINNSKPSYFKGETEAARTELVRVELNADGNEIDDTLEVVAEYAVDLKFGITVTEPGAAPNYTPKVTRYGIGVKKVYEWAASINDNGTPHHISAVTVRMSTRSPYADRRVKLPKANDGGPFRYDLGNGFARMRTLIADVFLPNQSGVMWK
jgi:hypothetical protein